jgi:hypothetical protein
MHNLLGPWISAEHLHVYCPGIMQPLQRDPFVLETRVNLRIPELRGKPSSNLVSLSHFVNFVS